MGPIYLPDSNIYLHTKYTKKFRLNDNDHDAEGLEAYPDGP